MLPDVFPIFISPNSRFSEIHVLCVKPSTTDLPKVYHKIKPITEGYVRYFSCWCCCCFIHCYLKGGFFCGWLRVDLFCFGGGRRLFVWWLLLGFILNRILTPMFLKQLEEVFLHFSEKKSTLISKNGKFRKTIVWTDLSMSAHRDFAISIW